MTQQDITGINSSPGKYSLAGKHFKWDTALRRDLVDFFIISVARDYMRGQGKAISSLPRLTIQAIDAIIKPCSSPFSFIEHSNSNTVHSLLLGTPTAIRKLCN